MSDKLSPAERSRVMASVRGKNTKPEILVRRALHSLGYRFRLHVTALPGKPDIVLPKYRTCIFVNGCFWHQHKGCKRASKPTSNIDFWYKKLQRNVERDKSNYIALERLGWRVIVVWECDCKTLEKLERMIAELKLGASSFPSGNSKLL